MNVKEAHEKLGELIKKGEGDTVLAARPNQEGTNWGEVSKLEILTEPPEQSDKRKHDQKTNFESREIPDKTVTMYFG